MDITCGIYFYDLNTDQILVGHVTNSNQNFSIPKGLFDKDKDEDYWAAAKREFTEETGLNLDDLLIPLTKELDIIQYKVTKKTLVPFLVLVDDMSLLDREIICISKFIDKDGMKKPEIDYFQWVSLKDAAELVHETQKANLPKINQIVTNIKKIK